MLSLKAVDEEGEQLLRGTFPFGFDHGIIARERFGTNGETRAKKPDPSDPCFLDRFRTFILTGIPDYRLQTTREGAG